MTPCSALSGTRRFGGTYRLHLQGCRIVQQSSEQAQRTTRRHIPEEDTLLCNVKLRKMNISDTFFFTSLIEAPKPQKSPEIFVRFTENTLLLKDQPKNGLRASSKDIFT
jgi:hypothetical protein